MSSAAQDVELDDPLAQGSQGRHLLCLFNERKRRSVLRYILDEREGLSAEGIRALSRHHLERPCVFHWRAAEFRVATVPGDCDSSMLGGNANWRGSIGMPVNMMLVRSLLILDQSYGDDFRIECPTGCG